MELYIHIPFCAKKCRYCDFLSLAGKEACFKDYIEALCAELDSYRPLIREKGLDTVFIGGGTPSILPVCETDKLLTAVAGLIAEGGNRLREYTVECNPGTLDAEKLELYKKHGVGRLSLGLQSADDDELKLLGRIHDHETFLNTYRLAREAGFDNINVDLISALPGQTVSSWEKTLRSVAELWPEHISAYSLIIEPGTPFYEIYGEKNKNAEPPLPDEDEEREIYRLTARILGEYGYSRYEISNYARPGFESKHNLGYWTGEDYIGAGLGASSYLCERDAACRLTSAVRFKNTTDLDEYIADTVKRHSASRTGTEFPIASGCGSERTELDRRDLIGEYMMLHLRLTQGFEEADFERCFGETAMTLFGDIINKYVSLGLMEKKNDRICLTEQGLDVSNSIMADFI